jgi:hypothetical protein
MRGYAPDRWRQYLVSSRVPDIMTTPVKLASNKLAFRSVCSLIFVLGAIGLNMSACSDDGLVDPPADTPDAKAPKKDSTTPPLDADVPQMDAEGSDAGARSDAAGDARADAGKPDSGADANTDAGKDATSMDAAPDATVDASDAAVDAAADATPPLTTSAQITAARNAAAGAGLMLPIQGAKITYLKPALGNLANDPAGFTIQADKLGPALFVAVDPANLVPVPAVGDVVSLTVTSMGNTGGLKLATAISNFARTATGADVAALAQDLSAAADVVSNIDSYESDLIDVSGTIVDPFVASGTAFEQATIRTAGITGNVDYRLRMPASVRDDIDAVAECTFTASKIPVGRFGAAVQLGAYRAADIALQSCPAPTVVSAQASASTTVKVTFSRRVDPASIAADGSQFTFDNGLVATAAVASGRVVTITTNAQGAVPYTVTGAATIKDIQGASLGAPNSALFTGFNTLAVVRINEVNAHITNSCDLIELRVTSGGSLEGFKLQERDTQTLVTFTNLVVPTNAIIVVHINKPSTSCNLAGASEEHLSPLEQPTTTFTKNYDTAYDWWSADTGLTDTDNVITLYDGLGKIMDAVFLDDDVPATAAMPNNVAGPTENQATLVAAAMQWQMVGGGVPVGGFKDDNFRLHACIDLDATGTSATGSSIQRKDNLDNNDKNDWVSVGSSFGLINAGQTPL